MPTPRMLRLLAFPLFLTACATGGAPSGDASFPEREGYVNSGNDVRLFYRLLGDGPDTIVVLHGGPGLTMDYMLDDLRPLAREHALLFYDQRGAGRSSLVSDSASLVVDRFVEDLDAIRTHFGMQRMTLLGHSWGTGLAAVYALERPAHVERLIIVGALPLRFSQLTGAFGAMQAARDTVVVRRMRELYEQRRAHPEDVAACRAYYVLWFEPFYADPQDAQRSRGDMCAGTTESRRNKMAGVDRFTMSSLGDWDWRTALRAITQPTLVIHGSEDPLPAEGARDWAATVPDAQLVLLDGVGHFPYVEAPELFFPAVERFLRQRRAASN